MDSLIFVTGNKKKAIEAQAILHIPVEIVDLDLDEVQSLDVKKIARQKARLAFKKIQKPLFVDDVGLYVEAWNGFPGPFIKFLFEAGGNDLLLKMLRDEKNKNVLAVGTIAYHDGEMIHIFQGEVRGIIADTARGVGLGWDPIFIPQDSQLTFAEMGEEQKNTISHRRRALEQFKKFLAKQTK